MTEKTMTEKYMTEKKMTGNKMMDKKIADKEITDSQMNGDRNADAINTMLETAKARLQWFATQASEEEFDEEEVSILVNYVKKMETQSPEECNKEAEQQEFEAQLERFRAYVNLYLEDEECRTGKKPDRMLSEKKRFSGKALAIAAAAASILLVILIGGTGNVVNADEDTGFFHWLKWDNEGMIAITSPEKNKVGEMAQADIKEYVSMEELPEEYHPYVVDKSNISLLKEYEFQKFVCTDKEISKKLTEVFRMGEEKEVQMGVLVYNDESVITGETLVGYEIFDTGFYGEHKQDVFTKKENGRIEYMVLFYADNKKYFVSGSKEVDFLEAVSKQYMDFVFD